jgi:hypothetical protein
MIRHRFVTSFVTKKPDSSPKNLLIRHLCVLVTKHWLSRMASMSWFVTRGDETAFSSLPGDESFVTRSSLVTNPGGGL